MAENLAKIPEPARSIITDSFDSGDAWGSVMSHRFGIAYVLWAVGEYVPTEWEFRTGSTITTASIREEESYPDMEWLEALESEEITPEDMRLAGNVLARWAEILRTQGRDY